jgi:hypothetical protein
MPPVVGVGVGHGPPLGAGQQLQVGFGVADPMGDAQVPALVTGGQLQERG